MTPTIVCAIEETTAEDVTVAGGEMAAALGASVILAHVRSDPTRFDSPAARERARHRTRDLGLAIVNRARELLPGDIEVEERVELGPTIPQLVAIAEDSEASFIVAGSRRRGAIATALLGSVSRTLAHEAPCPVLIVPQGNGARTRQSDWAPPPSTVIVGVDGSEGSVAATEVARNIADRFGDRLMLVYGQDRVAARTANPDTLAPARARAGESACVVVESGSPAQVLKEVAEREDARLIVIGTGRNSGIRALVENSVAEPLPGLAPCPVLVVSPREGRQFRIDVPQQLVI